MGHMVESTADLLLQLLRESRCPSEREDLVEQHITERLSNVLRGAVYSLTAPITAAQAGEDVSSTLEPRHSYADLTDGDTHTNALDILMFQNPTGSDPDARQAPSSHANGLPWEAEPDNGEQDAANSITFLVGASTACGPQHTPRVGAQLPLPPEDSPMDVVQPLPAVPGGPVPCSWFAQAAITCVPTPITLDATPGASDWVTATSRLILLRDFDLACLTGQTERGLKRGE